MRVWLVSWDWLQKVPYKVGKNMVINDIPHGDRMVCGNTPFIYARLVSNFVSRADYDKAIETIRWKEPSTVRWKEKSRREFVVAKEGDEQELIRELKCPLSALLLRNREN
jgi:hypothetical protein